MVRKEEVKEKRVDETPESKATLANLTETIAQYPFKPETDREALLCKIGDIEKKSETEKSGLQAKLVEYREKYLSRLEALEKSESIVSLRNAIVLCVSILLGYLTTGINASEGLNWYFKSYNITFVIITIIGLGYLVMESVGRGNYVKRYKEELKNLKGEISEKR